MLQPGRKYSSANGYRYGFNGKENDKDVKGEGNQQDYGMRIFDTRLGRFLSVDPITSKYPELTSYQFGSNRPIDGIDLDGKEWSVKTNNPNSKDGKYEEIYTVKLSLADPANKVHLQTTYDKELLNQMKTEAEAILSNPNASGEKDDPIIKVNIIFTEEEGPLKLNVRVFEGYIDENSKTGKVTNHGDPPAGGQTDKIGESQKNKVEIALGFRFISTKDNKVTGIGKTTAFDRSKFGRSLAHELGHTTGLYHTIKNLINKLKDSPENYERIKKNLMNTTDGGKDRPEELKTNEGKDLIPEQRKIIKETVTKQQIL